MKSRFKTNLELDLQTLQYVRHILAGTVKNARGAAKKIQAGQTHYISSGKSIHDTLNRDLDSIRDFLTSFEEIIEGQN